MFSYLWRGIYNNSTYNQTQIEICQILLSKYYTNVQNKDLFLQLLLELMLEKIRFTNLIGIKN